MKASPGAQLDTPPSCSRKVGWHHRNAQGPGQWFSAFSMGDPGSDV